MVENIEIIVNKSALTGSTFIFILEIGYCILHISIGRIKPWQRRAFLSQCLCCILNFKRVIEIIF